MKRLVDYPLLPVFEIENRDGRRIGYIERRTERLWTAYTGTGFRCKFLSSHLSKRTAVAAVKKAQ